MLQTCSEARRLDANKHPPNLVKHRLELEASKRLHIHTLVTIVPLCAELSHVDWGAAKTGAAGAEAPSASKA